MKKSIRRFLALFMAFAILAAYSFSPQNLTAFAVSAAEEPTVTAQEAEQKAEPTESTQPTTKAEPTKESQDETQAAPAEEPAEQETEAVTEEGGDEPTESTEATEATQPTEEEEAYPSQELSGSAGGVSVKVSAPEGALPAGTKLHVSTVSKDAVLEAVQDAIGDGVKIKKIKAVDITFKDRDGKKVEPNKEVSVSLHASGMNEESSQKAFHITDGGKVEFVAKASGGNATFQAEEFSTYGVEESVEAYTVNFYIKDNDTEAYETIYCEKGEAIGELPADPGQQGATFTGWFVKGSDPAEEVTAETVINSDMDVVAGYEEMVSVRFIMNDGTDEELIAEYDLVEGTTIGTMPQHPFKEGSEFVKWVKSGTDEEVTADTVVPAEGLVVEAVFKEIQIYDITVKYYYEVNGDRVDFGQDTYEIEAEEVPYTITPPASTKVDAQYIAEQPTYYPSQPTIQITSTDLENAENNTITKEVKYVEYTAQYDFVYLLKNLSGNGYTEIDRTHVKGVMGSTVTPTVLEYPYAEVDEVQTATITEASGQEVTVKYNRKNFTLSYDTNGGSYVHATTAPYGTEVSVSDTDVTKVGYTFQGWYTDVDLTQPVGSSITLTEDTTLYAKWEGKTVNYTIVYMKEKYDNSTGATSFVYDNSRTASGKVGTEVVATDAPDLTSNVNGYEKDAEWNATSKATIAADGSSVLVVRYKLIRYTFIFNINRNNGKIEIGGQTFSDSEYRIEDIVVGQDIGAQWPSSSNEISSTDRYFSGWKDGYHSWTQITKVQKVDYEYFEGANASHVVTWTAQWANDSANRNAEYWLQQPDGTYKKEDAYTQIGLNTTNLGAKEIDGYSTHTGTPSGYDRSGNAQYTETVWVDDYDDIYTFNGGNNYNVGDAVQHNGRTYIITKKTRRSGIHINNPYSYEAVCHIDGHYEERTTTVYTYRFYYDRQKYTITYYDGGTKLKTTDPIYYEADISGSEYNYTPAKPSGKEDFTWGGWHIDSGLNTPYTFNTMPGNNLGLYAKWIAPQFTVTFDLQGGSASFDTEQVVDKYSKVSSPGSPSRNNYIFDGWYVGTDEDSQLFDWEQPITEDTVIYAHWKQQTLGYTVHYYEEGTTNRLLADKIVSNPAFAEDETITENALSVAGYRPDASSKSLNLSFNEDNVITFYYSKRTGTTSYTVNYVLKDHPDIKVHESKTKTVDASQVSVREMAASVDKDYIEEQTDDETILRDNYYPMDDVKEFILSSDPKQNVITFEYANYRTSKVTVNYLDMDGDEIKTPDITYEKEGATYHVVTPSINGYIFHNKKDGNGESHSSYKINGDGDLTINLYYQKKLRITATNKNKVYDGTPLTSGANDYNVDGLAEGHTVSGIDFKGSQTDAGSSKTIPEGAVISGPESSNYYHITYVPGTLTVSPKIVFINVEPDRWNDGPAYDGTERTIGFRYLRDSSDPNEKRGVEITDTQYDNEYGKDIRDMVRNITRTETDAGFYIIPAETIREAITLPTDANYTVTLNIRDGQLTIPKAQATVATGSATKGYDGTPLTKAEASITGLVNNETATVTATGSQTEVGSSSNTYSINWGTAKATNYEITENLGTLEVTTNSSAVTLTAPSDSKTYDGSALTCDGTGEKKVTAEGLPEGFKVEATASGSQTDAGESPNKVDDDYVIKNAEDVDVTKRFTNVTKKDGTLTVNPAPVTIKTGSDSKPYDGTPLTKDEASIEGLVNNETATVTATGSQTEVGSSSNTYSIDWGTTNKDNYTVTENLGKLTVTQSSVEVTLTAPSDSKTYDGTALTCNGTGEKKVTASGLPEGFTVEATAGGSQTDAGNSKNVVNDGYKFFDKNGNDKTANFTNVKKVDGTLTVNPAPVTIATGSGNKAYDGIPLTNAEASITGLVNNETATVTATGSQTEVGSSGNTYSIEWGTAKASNYTVTENLGTLTVAKNDSEITLTAASGEKTYDGKELKDATVTVTGLPEGFTVEATASGSQTDVGESKNVVNDGYVIKDADGVDKTANFTNVKEEDGTLTVNPAPLTITTGSASKEYDGTPLTKDEASITGLVNNEIATVTATGSQTEVGSSNNTYTILWGAGAKASNYTITENLGKLTIT